MNFIDQNPLISYYQNQTKNKQNMSYMLDCPNLGKRHVGEFNYGGEYKERPKPDDDFGKWANYVFFRRNPAGKTLEWWYHRASEQWFLAYRNTLDNTDQVCFSYDDRDKFKEILEGVL